jgi:hypothetical protein
MTWWTRIRRHLGPAALKPSRVLILATLVCALVAAFFFWRDPAYSKNEYMPSDLETFADTIELSALPSKTVDLSKASSKLFSIGDDPSAYVTALTARGFKSVALAKENAILLSRERALFPPIGSKEHRVVIYLDENGRIKSVGSWLFSHTL